MHRADDVLHTIRMLQSENLDVRTVTMGINVNECAHPDIGVCAAAVGRKIKSRAGSLVRICDELTTRYGVPVINKRLAISSASILLEGHHAADAVALAMALDDAAAAVKIDLIGGFTALVHNGMTPGEQIVIDALPEVLSRTARLCASVNVGTTKAGINVNAIQMIGAAIKRTAEATSDTLGFGAAKFVCFANIPENNPFMAGAVLGAGEADCVINVGVSGPGVVKRAVERLIREHPDCRLDDIAEQIKHTTFRVTRTGELIGREVAHRLGVSFGAVDLSLAPTPRVGDSVGEIYQAMGVSRVGAPGTTAAVAMLNDAVKKGGVFASSSVGGLSGAFIPVMEDHVLARAVTDGDLSLEKLESMSSVCSVGLDMIMIPGDTDPAAICGILLDEIAIGVFNNKTTGVRIIPVPGKKAGDFVDFGGLFGSGTVVPIRCPSGGVDFVRRGGHIPAPINSLRN